MCDLHDGLYLTTTTRIYDSLKGFKRFNILSFYSFLNISILILMLSNIILILQIFYWIWISNRLLASCWILNIDYRKTNRLLTSQTWCGVIAKKIAEPQSKFQKCKRVSYHPETKWRENKQPWPSKINKHISYSKLHKFTAWKMRIFPKWLKWRV